MASVWKPAKACHDLNNDFTPHTTQTRQLQGGPHSGQGVAMVIMDQQDYNNKAQALLQDTNTYKVLNKDPTPHSKTSSSPYSKTSNNQEASAPKNTNNYTPLVQSHPNFMACPKYTKQAPPSDPLSPVGGPSHMG